MVVAEWGLEVLEASSSQLRTKSSMRMMRSSLEARRAAREAARNTALLMLPPQKSKRFANTDKSTSLLNGASDGIISFHISCRSLPFGFGNSSTNLKRRKKALSMRSFRLVMTITTPGVVSMWCSKMPTFPVSCRPAPPPSSLSREPNKLSAFIPFFFFQRTLSKKQ
jgi:hypothetical protein